MLGATTNAVSGWVSPEYFVVVMRWKGTIDIWRVENGVMVGETLEGKPKGNNYIVYRGDKTRDFDLKLQMKIEKGGGGGIQYRSVTGVPWTRPQPKGQPPYDLRFMMTGPRRTSGSP